MECWSGELRIRHFRAPIIIWEVAVIKISAIVLGFFMTALFAGAAAAGQAGYDEKAVANFYRGKTVTIVVGHSDSAPMVIHARSGTARTIP